MTRFLKLIMRLAARQQPRGTETSKKSWDLRCKLQLDGSGSRLYMLNDHIQDKNIAEK